jgi:cytochrome c-type biogenesis protein CcmE
MKRSLRSAHRRLWVVLAIAVGLAFAMALLLRAPAHAETMAAIGGILR